MLVSIIFIFTLTGRQALREGREPAHYDPFLVAPTTDYDQVPAGCPQEVLPTYQAGAAPRMPSVPVESMTFAIPPLPSPLPSPSPTSQGGQPMTMTMTVTMTPTSLAPSWWNRLRKYCHLYPLQLGILMTHELLSGRFFRRGPT